MWMWHHRHDPVESAVDLVGDEGGPQRQPAVVGLEGLPAELAAEAPVPKAVRDQSELVAAAIALVQSHGFCLLCRPPCPAGGQGLGLSRHRYTQASIT